MDFALYRVLTQQLAVPPDLAQVKQGALLPEEWPVVLEKIISYRKQVQSFRVTDGKTSILCVSDAPDPYERIATTELGTIVHLLGARTVFDQETRTYKLHVEDFCTLKQYDEHLKNIREEEARRLADLQDEMAGYRNYTPS